MISGMSCSMMSIEAPSWRRISTQQRAHRLGLALGDAGGRLVEAEHPGVEGEQRRRARRCGGCRSRARRSACRRSGRGRGSRRARRPRSAWPARVGRRGARTVPSRRRPSGRGLRARPRRSRARSARGTAWPPGRCGRGHAGPDATRWSPRPRSCRAARLSGGGHESADGVHQRRLARAVGADEPDDLAVARPRW